MNMIKNILFILLSCQKRFRLSPGFTLLEVLIAIAILGVSLITLFELFSGGLRLGRTSEDYLKATLFAQKKMNELRLANFTLKEGEESGKFEEDPNYLWTAIVEPFERDLGLEADDLEQETEEAGKKTEEEKKKKKKRKPMQKVELKVSWKSGGKSKELSLVRLFNPIKWNYQDFVASKPKEKDAAGSEAGKEKK